MKDVDSFDILIAVIAYGMIALVVANWLFPGLFK